jgi:hypothetical protein
MMAEFGCIITENEYSGFLEAALAGGFKLCLNKYLPRPEHEYVTERRAVPHLLHTKQYAFLLERDDFSRYPVRLIPIERKGVKVWYPRAKEGGPVIETYFWAPFTKGDARFIPCSLIACSAKIVNPMNGTLEPAGDAVKRAYNTLIAPLRKNFKKVRSTKRVAYVSPGAQAMIGAGWRLADPFDSANVMSNPDKQGITAKNGIPRESK